MVPVKEAPKKLEIIKHDVEPKIQSQPKPQPLPSVVTSLPKKEAIKPQVEDEPPKKVSKLFADNDSDDE